MPTTDRSATDAAPLGDFLRGSADAGDQSEILRGVDAFPHLSPDLFAVVEQPDYRVEFLNTAGRKMLGLEKDETLEDRSWMEFIPGNSLWTLLNDAVPTAWRSGSWTGDMTLRRMDGSEMDASVIVLARKAASTGRKNDCLWLMARDTTAVHATINGLKRDQRFLRVLLENSPDCIYFKDVNSRFLRASHGMASRFGVSDPKKMEGKSDFDFFTDEHARPAYEQEREIIRTERPIIDLEEKETYIDGRIAWVSTSKMPLHNEYGQVVGTFGVSRDITGRKQTEAALAQAQRSLIETSRLAGMAEVASGVLHNIGNAFNSVNTSVTLLADQTTRLKTVNFARAVALLQEHAHELPRFLTEDPRGRQLPTYFEQLSAQFTQDHQNLTTEIKSLLRGVEHIKGVIAMQQNYTRASTMLEDLSPAELMKEALGITDAANNRHQIEVINEWGAVPNVRAARHRVLEILVNLISNAKHAVVDAGRSERKIWLLIRSGGEDRVQFVVADNGVGIKPENLQRIFSFGFTTRSKGHGFGLHSSAVAAQDMDGSLKAFSEGLGHGAQFILELPASPAAGNV